MKTYILLVFVLLLSLSIYARELSVGDVISWTRNGKYSEGRITEVVRRNGRAVFLRVYQFGSWTMTEVRRQDAPRLIAWTQ